jgi:hypothetical protein
MAKKGRKRKAGNRTASGQLSRSMSAVLERGERELAMRQPHRAWLPEAHRLDQRAESELGRIYLAGHISEPQCWAGERWREIVREYRYFLASPVTPGSALGRMVASTIDPDAWRNGESGTSERAETDEEKRSRVLARHGAALREIPRSAFPVMEAVVILDRALDPALLPALQVGLAALARLWKMSDEVPLGVRGSRSERPSWGHDEKEVTIVYSNP